MADDTRSDLNKDAWDNTTFLAGLSKHLTLTSPRGPPEPQGSTHLSQVQAQEPSEIMDITEDETVLSIGHETLSPFQGAFSLRSPYRDPQRGVAQYEEYARRHH